MFDDIIRELKKLERPQKLSVPILSDKKGYTDYECPREECMFKFKVNNNDWENICTDEAVYCPYCGLDAPASNWYTQEQIQHANKEAYKNLAGQVQNALKKGARRSNQKNRSSGFLSCSIEVSGPHHRSYLIPTPALEVLQLEIKCEKCSTRFAVIGSAYFCPACGFNSIERTFDDSVKKIEAKISNLNTIRKALKESVGLDQAEVVCRSMIESCIQDAIVALQRLSEQLYKNANNGTAAPSNAFQRIGQSSNLWRNLYNEGYEDWLSEKELSDLKILYNKRHLLAHREGIIDGKYLDNTNDRTYKAGQRIIIKEPDVHRLVKLVTKISIKVKVLANTST